FFQAEDGIRDFHVTGVQTCALPISFVALNYMLIALLGNAGRFLSIVILMLQLASSAGTYPVELLPDFFRSIHEYLPMTYSVQGRSEERRVGKERRAGSAPDPGKRTE